MIRRRFLSTSAASAGVGIAATSYAVGAQAGRDTPWDFVIVGAGTAGMSAALFAAHRSARVLMIDSAERIGGTLHMALGQIAAAGTRTQLAKGITDDTPDKHFDDVMAISRGLADPAIVRRTVDLAPAMLNWLLDNGLTPLPDHPVTGESPGRPAYRTPRYLWGANMGRDILAVLQRAITPELGSGRVVVQTSTRATEVLIDRRGNAIGIRAVRDGRTLDFKGRNIIVATGGYAMNPALFERLNGCPAYVAGSYPTNQGDALAMLTAVGARLRGHELHRPGSGSILTSDVFPAKAYARFNTVPQVRAPWEIWVNTLGRRYVREDEPDSYLRERRLVNQPRQKYAIVFDDAIFNTAPPGIPDWSREKMAEHFARHPMFIKAETPEALARGAGLDPSGLVDTITSYNAAVAGAPDAFGREHKPLPIAMPPFYAIIHHGHSATSSVGVVVDDSLRVLGPAGGPIKNLYAVGEVLGSGATLGDAFVPGMMLTPALSLGRWLGMSLPLG